MARSQNRRHRYQKVNICKFQQLLGQSCQLLCREEENKGELKIAKEKRKEGMRDDERKYRPHVPPFFGL